MVIELYHNVGSSRARAVEMTARHLNIDIKLINVDFIKFEHMSPDYIKINPTHKVPTLIDGNLTLWESRACMQYLCNQYAPDSSLYPKEPKKRALVDKWLYIDMPYFDDTAIALVMKVFFGIEPTEQQLEKYKNTLKLIDSLIGDNKYLAGDNVTIADLTVLSTTTYLYINEFKDLDEFPNLKAWFERIQTELPYYEQVNGKLAEMFDEIKLHTAEIAAKYAAMQESK